VNRYGLDGPGIDSLWRRNFPARPDRPRGPPSLLYSDTGSLSRGGEQMGRGGDPLPPFSAEVANGLQLFPSPLCACLGMSWGEPMHMHSLGGGGARAVNEPQYFLYL